jgi:hypothetical protein
MLVPCQAETFLEEINLDVHVWHDVNAPENAVLRRSSLFVQHKGERKLCAVKQS